MDTEGYGWKQVVHSLKSMTPKNDALNVVLKDKMMDQLATRTPSQEALWKTKLHKKLIVAVTHENIHETGCGQAARGEFHDIPKPTSCL